MASFSVLIVLVMTDYRFGDDISPDLMPKVFSQGQGFLNDERLDLRTMKLSELTSDYDCSVNFALCS